MSPVTHILSAAELAKRLHVHAISDTSEARNIKRGELDIGLILDAGLSVPDQLRDNPSVLVSIHCFATNHANGKQDAVFSAFDPSTNEFLGHYMGGAFKSLSLVSDAG